jgi:hypothetical protein
MPEALRAGVGRRFGHQGQVPYRGVRGQGVLCGPPRGAVVARRWRRRAGLRARGEVVHALGAQEGPELLRHLRGQQVRVDGRGRRPRGAVSAVHVRCGRVRVGAENGGGAWQSREPLVFKVDTQPTDDAAVQARPGGDDLGARSAWSAQKDR